MRLSAFIRPQIAGSSQAQIYVAEAEGLTEHLRIVGNNGRYSICMLVLDETLGAGQAAMVEELASFLGIKHRDQVELENLSENELSEYTLKNVWFSMSNQYTSRTSMFLMGQQMVGKSLFTGQVVDYREHIWKSKVERLSTDKGIDSGIISPVTRFCFLSASAKMFIILQITEEVLRESPDKMLAFFADLFKRWKEAETLHVVSIVACARARGPNGVEEDYYHVLEDWNILEDWCSRLDQLKVQIQCCIDEFTAKGPLAPAKDSCFLEAIGLVLGIYDRYHLDRDLTQTGLSVLILSYGDGRLSVEDPALFALLKTKAIGIGVWVHLLLVGNEVSSIAPTFEISNTFQCPNWIQCDVYFPKEILDLGGDVKMEGHCARWGLFPPKHFASGEELSWTPLVSPPALPLLDSLDGAFDPRFKLVKDYNIYPNYTSEYLKVNENYSESEVIRKLALELALLRVAQGYQISTLDENRYIMSSAKFLQTISFNEKICHISVSIYTCAIEENPIDYTFNLFDGGEWTKRSKKATPSSNYDWEALDTSLVSGKIDDLPGMWKTRFILVPGAVRGRKSIVESVLPSSDVEYDETDVRVAAFVTFIQQITAVHGKPASPTDESTLARLGITVSTNALSSYVSEELARRRSHSLSAEQGEALQKTTETSCLSFEPLRKNSTFERVAELMQHPLVGIPIQKRKWFFSSYDNAFIGSEAVDWIMKFYEDVANAEEAISVGQNLIDKGVWEHVNDQHPFIDGHFYYRFTDRFLQETKSSQVMKSRRHPVELSSKIVLNLDPASERKEWVNLHYDTVHNPKIAFHFQLHWLNCSSRLLDTLIHSWSLKARRLGFELIEVPVLPPTAIGHSPFEMGIFIELAAQPPSIAFLLKHWDTLLIEEFLVRQNFVLDLEPDERFPPNPSGFPLFKRSAPRPPVPHLQYVSRSGEVIIQVVRITEGKFGFLWHRNRLSMLTPSYVKTKSIGLEEFRSLCADKDEMESFWNTLVHDLTHNPTLLKSAL